MTDRFNRLLNGPIKDVLSEADALVVSEPQNVFLTSDMVPPTLRLLPERLLMPVFHANSAPFWVIADITVGAFRQQSKYITDWVVYKEYVESPIDGLVRALRERGFVHHRILVEKNHLSAHYYEALKAALPAVRIDDATPYMERMRMIKSDQEQAQLQQCANMTLEAIRECYEETRIGDSEIEIRSRAVKKLFDKGFDTFEFLTLARGRGDLLNGKPTDESLEPGDMLRVDIGGTMAGWRSDIHRTAVAGAPSPQQKECWAKNRDVHYMAIATMQPGAPIRETYELCLREYEQRGMHCDMPFIGHSLGVGQHEEPMITPFAAGEYEPGMIVMLEPMGIDRSVGGFSIEDMILIGNEGPRVLSDAVGTEEMLVIDSR